MTFQEFKEKYQKVEVEELENQVPKDVKVSVCVQTYNHENYIRECLDSILMQETNFAYEILLGEDESKDGTREICLEYAEKHPDKIRLFLHHRANNIKINGSPTGRFNFLYNLYSAKGKFIALCEGDDYWTDPLKLQRQVNLLENNLDIAISAENSLTVNEITGKTSSFSFEKHSREYSIEDLLKGRKFHTASILFPTYLLNLPLNAEEYPSGDTLVFISLAKKGKVHYSPSISSVYRRNENGVSNRRNRFDWAQNVEKFNLMLNEYLEGKFKDIHWRNIYLNYYTALKWSVKTCRIGLACKSLYKLLQYKK